MKFRLYINSWLRNLVLDIKEAGDSCTQSSAEAESAAMTTSQAIWLKRILEDMGESQEDATEIDCDISYSKKNIVFHSRTKHIGIKYHFIREKPTKRKNSNLAGQKKN